MSFPSGVTAAQVAEALNRSFPNAGVEKTANSANIIAKSCPSGLEACDQFAMQREGRTCVLPEVAQPERKIPFKCAHVARLGPLLLASRATGRRPAASRRRGR
jgi:hypothetical protein